MFRKIHVEFFGPPYTDIKMPLLKGKKFKILLTIEFPLKNSRLLIAFLRTEVDAFQDNYNSQSQMVWSFRNIRPD